MKVSVIIPIYNAAQFLDKSIQSTLDQKQTGEVLLIDDRSTDESLEICKKWERNDSRVKVFLNEGTKGAGAARNVGLKNATCEYVAFLDADDYYLDGRFEEDEKLYTSRNNVVSIASSVLIKTYNSSNIKYLNRIFENNKICGGIADYTWVSIPNLLYESSIKITGLSMKKSIALELNGFNEKLKQCQDTDFLVRLILNYSLFTAKIDHPICIRNIHLNNSIGNIKESIYYRKIAYKKFLKIALFKLKDLKLGSNLLKSYFELDFYNILGSQTYPYKRILKMILSPIVLFKLIFITKSVNDQNL